MPKWGTQKWGTLKWGYTPPPPPPTPPAPTYPYAPGPPPAYEFVMPPMALDPQTPLMSIQATGHFRHTWLFKLRPTHYSKTGKRPKVKQYVYKYWPPAYHRSPCENFRRNLFKEAVHTWQTMSESERKPFIDYPKHYGLCMHGRNYFIGKFMKANLDSPLNPCENRPRRDSRRLRRDGGRT